MSIWAWMQPVDRIWKVVTDLENGKIEVYNEKSELVMEQKHLEKDAVLLIEENFLKVVATRLTGENDNNNDQKVDNVIKIPLATKKYEYNNMYA